MTSNVYADAMGDAFERLEGLGYERGEHDDLANHGPMGAEALSALGFGSYVASWVEDYKRAMTHHDPPQPQQAIDESDQQSWKSALGQFHRVGDWEVLFRRELDEQPWRSVLALWWPRLLPGLMGRITHGLIRTAHAIRCASSPGMSHDLAMAELARGLAYWASRYMTLPGDSSFAGHRDVAGAIAELPRMATDGADGVGLGGQRLQGVENSSGYLGAISALAPLPAQRRLSELTATFAGIYLAHPEGPAIPLVHGVTAPAALRLVLPHLPEDLHATSVAAMWQVHVALLLMFTTGGDGEQRSLSTASESGNDLWPNLVERALLNGDEHAIKFTEACQRENQLQPDPRYAAAVESALGRIPPRALRGD